LITRTHMTTLRRATGLMMSGFLALSTITGAAMAQQSFGPRAGQPAPQGQAQPQAGAPAGAPAGQPAAPKAEIIATHGDWKIQCSDFPNPAAQANGGKSDSGAPATIRSCGMTQTARSPERENVGMTLVMFKQKQGDKNVTMMRILVPVGVYLPTGVALEIDSQAVGRVPFIQCLPQFCMAIAEATPESLEKMKKGTKANFIIYEGPGAGVSIDVSLKGFTAALGALDKASAS